MTKTKTKTKTTTIYHKILHTYSIKAIRENYSGNCILMYIDNVFNKKIPKNKKHALSPEELFLIVMYIIDSIKKNVSITTIINDTINGLGERIYNDAIDCTKDTRVNTILSYALRIIILLYFNHPYFKNSYSFIHNYVRIISQNLESIEPYSDYKLDINLKPSTDKLKTYITEYLETRLFIYNDIENLIRETVDDEKKNKTAPASTKGRKKRWDSFDKNKKIQLANDFKKLAKLRNLENTLLDGSKNNHIYYLYAAFHLYYLHHFGIEISKVTFLTEDCGFTIKEDTKLTSINGAINDLLRPYISKEEDAEIRITTKQKKDVDDYIKFVSNYYE